MGIMNEGGVMTALEIWADPVTIPRAAGGSFAATLWTIWHHPGDRWHRIGSTISPSERDRLIAGTGAANPYAPSDEQRQHARAVIKQVAS